MKLQRLFSMPPAELAFRGRQQAYKNLERLIAAEDMSASTSLNRFNPRFSDRVLKRSLSRRENGDWQNAARLLQRSMEQVMPQRFFAGASDERLKQHFMASRDCAWAQAIIANADAICRGEFSILGYGQLSYGVPVNWQFDPVSGNESPMVHWSRINPLSLVQVGDSKVVWELNRHQWLLDLGQAYRITGDDRYARRFAELVTDWMHCNPPGMGINWSSALEVAMRLIAWCWALFLFRGAEALTAELFHTMVGWMQQHARFVERNLSRYYSPNTHLTVEALGLFYAGTLLPELQGAMRWRALGSQVLGEELQRQVHPDGVYFEQSTRYQYYTVETYLHFVILAERNHVELSATVRDSLQRMLEFLLHVRRPDGSLPQIGDADGGWLLPLIRRESGDYRGLFSTAALVFNNSQFAMAADTLAAETLWFLGVSAQDSWSSISPEPPLLEPLKTFRDGGYVVMRNSWGGRAHQLIFDTGPLGCPVSSGHGHADLLSIQCSAWGENYLVDAGTCCYTADAHWRDYFRSSEPHSTVLVDGRSQAEPASPFSWHKRPTARIRNCLSHPGFMLAEAEHDAYHHLNDPVSHRRRVLFIGDSYWLIVDDLTGDAEHHIDLRYQFAPLQVAVEEDGWVRARGKDSELLLKTFSTVVLNTAIHCGELSPALGWVSPNYGQRIPAPLLTYTTSTQLPLRVVSLIFPLESPALAAPKVSPMIEGTTITGLFVGAGEEAFIRI